ncbi:MAG: molybdate ABC transporter permease subunit, partial [Alphaproteobacteria bacterium]|nr:molybdate ABC transporter permease subunit [Alphaproteobacteria bacterium]
MFQLTNFEIEAILLSLKVSTSATLIALGPAFMLAYLFSRSRFPGKTLLYGIVHLPLVLPPVVVGLLLLMSFSPTGWAHAIFNDYLGLSFAFNWKG